MGVAQKACPIGTLGVYLRWGLWSLLTKDSFREIPISPQGSQVLGASRKEPQESPRPFRASHYVAEGDDGCVNVQDNDTP